MTSRSFVSLVAAVAESATPASAAEVAVRGLATLRNAALVRLWLVDNDLGVLRLAASAGDTNDSERFVHLPRTLSFETARRLEARDAEALADASWLQHSGVHTIALPLACRGARVGLLAVFDRSGVDDDDLEMLVLFASATAGALSSTCAAEQATRTADRLETENATLRESLRDLFDEAPIAYVHEGLDTRFIRANRAALSMLGIEQQDISRTFGNTFVADTPGNQQRLRLAFDAVEQGNEPRGVTLELRRKDNHKPVWVQSQPAIAPGTPSAM